MRSALLATMAVILLSACTPMSDMPTQSTGLPPPTVTLLTSVVRRDLVRLVWSVQNGQGRQFETLRRHWREPWKHFSTVVPVDGRITIEDTGVVAGQGYTYRVRIFGSKGEVFLDEIDIEVPL